MADYISREEAILAIQTDCPEQVFYSREDAIERISTVPAADVEPVVRCRDCIYFDPGDEDGLCCADVGAMLCPGGDDYCSHGQRKDQSADVRKKEDIPDAAKEAT